MTAWIQSPVHGDDSTATHATSAGTTPHANRRGAGSVETNPKPQWIAPMKATTTAA